MPRLFKKNALKCTQIYHLCILYCLFCLLCNINILTDIEPTTKSPDLTNMMKFPQIKLLTGAILMTS